jgi:hypothetical protein
LRPPENIVTSHAIESGRLVPKPPG